jgi:transposase InsO family protein
LFAFASYNETSQSSSGHTNAMAESFNATIKKELIHLHTWPTLRAVRNAIFEYSEVYYNRKRPHSSIGNATPSEMEHSSLETIGSEMAATT